MYVCACACVHVCCVCVCVCVCIFSDDGFVIPELPSGQELVLNILSTWGDKHYVGFTSLQVFASTGEQVQVKKVSSSVCLSVCLSPWL